MVYYLQFLAVRFIASILCLLPFSVTVPAVRFFTNILYLVLSKRRRIAKENIRRAFGASLSEQEINRIARSSIQNVALSIVELLTITKVKKNAADLFTIEGLENYEKAEARNKGVILVCSHMGSWEFMSFFYYLTKRKISVIVKKIRNPHIDRKIDKARREIDLNPIPKTSSIRSVFKELKKNHSVAILIDQWAGPDGLWLDFFEHKTSTTSLPTRLALKTGAVMVPGFCLREKGYKFKIQILEPIEVNADQQDVEKDMTERLNRILEQKIKEYPDQWTWSHRRWKPRPSGL